MSGPEAQSSPSSQPQLPNPSPEVGAGAEEVAAGETPLLFHEEFNPAGTTTIVLLHGLISCHLEYSLVIPHLSPTYHILAVDLPGHSGSRSFATGTADNVAASVHPAHSASLVAALIRARARPHGGGGSGSDSGETKKKAHIVGLSMGGFVALELARLYPDVCLSVFVTGAAPFEGLNAFVARSPRLVHGMQFVETGVPAWAYGAVAKWMGIKPHEELRREQKGNLSREVVSGVYKGIMDVGWDKIVELGGKGLKVLTVAGGKMDDVPATKRMGEELRKAGGRGCRAVVVKKALHMWDLQFPELFAEGIMSWIEERELPSELEEL